MTRGTGETVDALLLINNRDISASNGATFERRSPLTNQVATRAAAASVADALSAAEAAAAALPAWAALGPSARRALLLKAADALESRASDFIAAMTAETGATEAWARFNISLAAGIMREAAALTTQVSGEVIPSDKPGCVAFTVRRPAGVILGIAPWNAPVILGVRAIAAPLACGNTVILKASELCPRTHWLIAEALRDAGFPPGVCNIVTNAPADAPTIVAALIAHPAVRRINFTGSTKVGRVIARLGAEQLKPVLLELGGKAPFLVLDDADLEEAAAAAAFGAFFNQGQICMSTERIIVVANVADAFVAKFVAKVMTLKAGDPREGTTPLGSMVDPSAVARVAELIDDAVLKGAVLHRAAEPQGTLLSAAVLDGVTPDMAIYADESFGPVTAIIRVADEEEAVRVANNSEYGLTSAVFTRDAARGLRVAERLDAGMCHINGPTVHDEAQMPFGGTKSSGFGRFGGKAGIAEFTELRWITIETQKGHFPI
jgi:acyl-CoA reductase-like NAD-dependent aldehyde dehydrogenase